MPVQLTDVRKLIRAEVDMLLDNAAIDAEAMKVVGQANKMGADRVVEVHYSQDGHTTFIAAVGELGRFN